MTCANCVITVERGLKKTGGVLTAAVNLSSERATVEYDPKQVGLPDLIARVNRIGYGIASGEADLAIQRMSDDSDARVLEKTLNKLDEQIGQAKLVSVSCARLIRVDFIAAGDLLNWVLSKRGE